MVTAPICHGCCRRTRQVDFSWPVSVYLKLKKRAEPKVFLDLCVQKKKQRRVFVPYVPGPCKIYLRSSFSFSYVVMLFMRHVWVRTCRFRLILFYDISNSEALRRGVSVEASPCMFSSLSGLFLLFFWIFYCGLQVNPWSRRDWVKDVPFVIAMEKVVGYYNGSLSCLMEWRTKGGFCGRFTCESNLLVNNRYQASWCVYSSVLNHVRSELVWDATSSSRWSTVQLP